MTNSEKLPPIVKPRTFLGIQALRGIAAVMVTVYHYTLFWSVEFVGPHNSRIWTQGASGVDIFFLISGFVMAISATGSRTPTAFDFMRRRVIRIVPLYWLVTLTICAKRIYLALHPALHQGSDPAISLRYALACLFFIPARDANGNVLPIVNPGWTLNLEMFFYVLFAMALLLKIKPVRFLTPVMILVAAVGVAGFLGSSTIGFLTNPILLEFLAGVLLAYAVRSGFKIDLRLGALLGLAGFAVLTTVPPGDFALARALEWGVPALLILIAAVMLEERYGRLWPAWMLMVGDASYSLYLIHVLLVGPLLKLAHKVPLAQAHEAIFVIGSLAISMGVARMSYWLIEKHLTRLLSRLTSTALPVNIERASPVA